MANPPAGMGAVRGRSSWLTGRQLASATTVASRSRRIMGRQSEQLARAAEWQRAERWFSSCVVRHLRRRLCRATHEAVPATMQAAAIDRFGGPSVLKLHELPTPTPEADQVLIAIHTAGVGNWDAEIRDGSWRKPGRPRFPRVLGLDGAGVVVAKGNRVRRLAIGDRVWAYDYENGGFYAQYVAVDADHAGRVPKRMSLRDAGAVAVTALTALQGVADTADVRRGQTVLVFGATGAVGTLALQFAASRGARVIAT